MPRKKTTHAGVEVSRRDDESVEHGLDLVDEVRDGRLLRLRGRQVRVPLRQRLKQNRRGERKNGVFHLPFQMCRGQVHKN